jgi:hypothetical protein
MNRARRNLERYVRARSAAFARLGEPVRRPSLPAELALQASFYGGEFGLAWRGTGGEQVEAIHFGTWNREPGPDFVGAKLQIDGRMVAGDIELDTEDLDWERHGHAANPAFDNVILHVFFRAGSRRFYTRTSQNAAVPQVMLDAGGGVRRRNLAPSGPPTSDPSAWDAFLEAAVRFRMARKRERWLKAVALHGPSEALFQALASGLGYKNNSVPFLLLAQRSGLSRAGSSSGEALLFGIAGFLDARGFDSGTPAMRSYARGLWETWWSMRDQEARLQLPPDAWTLGPVRPANHPHRRTGALATIARNCKIIEKATFSADHRAFLDVLRTMEHPFWNAHASLGGKPLAKPCALIGAQRAADLAANVFCPTKEESLEILHALPCGSPSGRVTRAASWLGLTLRRPRPNTAFLQQALLQAYEDFHPLPAAEVLDLFKDEG